MQVTQFISFEITTKCNLDTKHKACPVSDPRRFESLDTTKQLDDETIVRIASDAYNAYGFTGFICWHYYNEPLMAKERMFRLMHAIREKAPQSRFFLWTNGELIPRDACEEFSIFEHIRVSNYAKLDYEFLRKHVKHVTVTKPKLDERRTIVSLERNIQPCVRPYTEFIVDFYGNVHMCCIDWQGKAGPFTDWRTADRIHANVMHHPFLDVLEAWQMNRQYISQGLNMAGCAPSVCLHCPMKYVKMSKFDKAIRKRAQKHRREL